MLHRIVIINSETYAKANLCLKDIDSIQLVGENNVGKSSLINALNFLYITDQRQMHFEGGRNLQASLPHYFPDVRRSFILFEIVRKTPYLILVRRNADNQLVYYHIPHGYMPHWFFADQAEGKEIYTFDQLLQNLAQEEIPIKKLNREALYHQVYGDKEDSDAVVQLTSLAARRGRGHANHFSRIYKYLITASRISPDDLTDALLTVADKRSKQLQVFADRNNDSLEKLTALSAKIIRLREVADDFFVLKELHERYDELHKQLGRCHYTFCEAYPNAIRTLQQREKDILGDIGEKKALLEVAHQAQAKMNQQLGGIGISLQQQQATATQLQAQLKEVAPYQKPLAFSALQQEVSMLEEDKQRLLQALRTATAGKDPKLGLRQYVDSLKAECQRLEQQIVGYDNGLIQHISTNPKVQKKLSALLSPTLLHSPKAFIQKKITKLTDKMSLFDGVIDVAGIAEVSNFRSVEVLKIALQEKKKALQLAQQLQQEKDALEKLEASLTNKRNLLQQVTQIPDLLRKEKDTEVAIEAFQAKVQQLQEVILEKQEAIKRYNITIKARQEEAVICLASIQKFSSWREWLAGKQLPLIAQVLEQDDLAAIYDEIGTLLIKQRDLYQQQEELFRRLTRKLGRYDDKVGSFIEQVGKEIAHIDALEVSRTKLFDGVLNHFIQPTRDFLVAYQEFQQYVAQFSEQLSQHQISGIHALSLHLNELTTTIQELTQISEIKEAGTLDLHGSREEQLELLKNYIARGRTFCIKDLFRLELKMTLQPHSPAIRLDTTKQMQSYGTDKVLRLFIFLQLLRALVKSNAQDRIVIYVDEVGTIGQENIKKIKCFCKAGNILPIFASISFVEGFEKYYSLIPSPQNQGRVWIDDTYAIRERVGKAVDAV